MSKKIITLMLVLILTVTLTACGKSAATETGETVENVPVTLSISKIDAFYEKWDAMESNLDKVLDPFAENPEITEKFLADIHKVEEEYIDLMEYVDTLTVAEYKYGGQSSIESEVEAYWVREPIMEVNYNDSKFRHGWDYYDGSVKIDAGYYVIVDWTENIATESISDDFENEREYTIVDPTKDAYILLLGECGYEMIRIIAE